MKKGLLNIGSIFLAMLVLFSTFSFTIEKHLCAGEVADISLTGNLERCEMPVHENEESPETTFDKMHCCQDIIETIESSNDELTIVNEIELQQQVFVVAFMYSYINQYDELEQQIVPFKDYKPPLVTKDIQVLHDTFLI